jgi:hypothetical protein
MKDHASYRPNHKIVEYGLDGKASMDHTSFFVDDEMQSALESTNTTTRNWYQYNEVKLASNSSFESPSEMKRLGFLLPSG